MLASKSNEFGLLIQSHVARFSASYGATVTPAENAYGSYATVLAGGSVTDDAFGIFVFIHGIGVATLAKDALVTIGVDPAGGTSFTDLIPDLIASSAGAIDTVSAGAGIMYWFPLKIKAGSTIGAKASVNNATVGTAQVAVILQCRPSHPHLVRAGTFVRAFGITAATSKGTAITTGTTSDGTYVQMGSALAEPLWFFQAALARNDNAMGYAQVAIDLAIGSSTSVNRQIIFDQMVWTTTSEMINAQYNGVFANGAVGDLLFVRGQTSGTGTTNWSAAAYGVGG